MKEFMASRWSTGNLFFPIKLSIDEKGVTVNKPGIFTRKDESIPHNKIASIGTSLRMLGFSDIIVTDNSGEKITFHGFKQTQAKEMKELIYKYTHK